MEEVGGGGGGLGSFFFFWKMSGAVFLVFLFFLFGFLCCRSVGIGELFACRDCSAGIFHGENVYFLVKTGLLERGL